ncbi:SixA phosphatase family protein [Haliangium ochraceum]|uniref:Phosphohistidine phosphatase, SixA n=1 Tax=Haliangium ochraceum (strain DSM 14365 / JCM 11303 / SMP-2) TaxID=502025 RepID=D0LW60_HALO1|nr:histidine phosphatase family protein [Haliangium ochraceum]ACY15992.1 phosphohistidine phosphatase, SixA [Haliangium ochraceum DSM 14365]
MEVFVIRHAIAVEPHEAPSDAARPLTERGIKRFQQTVRGLAQLGIGLERVFHSPWVRAQQTAELLTPLLSGTSSRGLEATPLLAEPPSELLLERARALPAEDRLAFVGHEPWMGQLVSLLVTGSLSHGYRFPFKKGGVACLEGEPGAGTMAVSAILPPRLTRTLAKAP